MKRRNAPLATQARPSTPKTRGRPGTSRREGGAHMRKFSRAIAKRRFRRRSARILRRSPGVEVWTLVALVPFDREDPPAEYERRARPRNLVRRDRSLAPHLAGAGQTGCPRIEPVEFPSSPGPREIRLSRRRSHRSASLRIPDPGRGLWRGVAGSEQRSRRR